MFQFSCRFAFLSTSRLSNRTPIITRILTLYQAKRANFHKVQFLTHKPELIIFGAHNLQTFKHNTLVSELLQFNIRPKLHHRKWRKLRVTPPVNMHALFSACSLRDDNVITSKPTWKLKHTNSIPEYFEYLCQMSSKSILIILSYMASKLVRFLRYGADILCGRPPRAAQPWPWPLTF